MVVIMVVCYLLCWLPYGVVALLATFGPPGLLTPEASIIPSILAKTSTVVNPVIYVFMNKQVRLSGAAFVEAAFSHRSVPVWKWEYFRAPITSNLFYMSSFESLERLAG